MAPRSHRKSSRSSRHHHRSTLSLQKTEIIINVYDLLAPGRLSSILWHIGTSLLHSGVVINGKEYAYGGHDRRGVTGVYWTKPRSVPPGGTFRCEILHGFTLATPEEIDSIIHAASEKFLGTSYNLLTQNCNHFTAYLCRELTGRPGPNWLNRAASIGVALPCVVPREWIEPPEYDTTDGALLTDDEDRADDYTDNDHLLQSGHSDSPPQLHLVGVPNPLPGSGSGPSSSSSSQQSGELSGWNTSDGRRLSSTSIRSKGNGRGPPMRDADGHALPPSERLPGL